jgi:hypothetical protein
VGSACGIVPGMRRLSIASVLVLSLAGCERAPSSTPPESGGGSEVAASESAPIEEPEAEPAPEPEPEPEREAAVSEVAEPVLEKDGFVARDVQCTLSEATVNGDRYILAGLTDPEVDAALDACAPKGAAIQVEWSYVSGQAADIAVVATSPKQANCIAAAMTKVRAGVSAKCSAVLLVGDLAAATKAYEAR